jgi:hypothetical protein
MSKSQTQRRIGIAADPSNVVTADQVDLSKLPKALARAIQEGWLIAPVAAHSKHASLTRSCLLEPSNLAPQIAYWGLNYPNANYCVVTGHESRLAILEVSHESQDLLCDLCNDTWEGWLETLKFSDGLSTFFMFRYEGQRVRFLPSRVKGIKIHSGTRVFLPPSWFVVGPGLNYTDMAAKVLDCPAFLLDASETPSESGKVIPFPEDLCRLSA